MTVAWTRVKRLKEVLDYQHRAVEAAGAQAGALDREYQWQLVTLGDLIEARRTEYQGALGEIDTRYQLMIERLNLLALTNQLAELATPDEASASSPSR